MIDRHEMPEESDRFWNEMGGYANLGARATPYRQDSNVNFIIHNNDRILNGFSKSKK